MKLKNINNLFLLIIIQFFFISCSKIDLINKDKTNIEIVENETIVALEKDKEEGYIQNNESFNFFWQPSTELKKIYDISFGKKSEIVLQSTSTIIILDDFAYYVNSQAKFTKFDLKEKNIVFEIELHENIDSQLSLPISLERNDNHFYIGFGNGLVIKTDTVGDIIWKKDFNDLLRTPIKIVNENKGIWKNGNWYSNGNWEYTRTKWYSRFGGRSANDYEIIENKVYEENDVSRCTDCDEVIGKYEDHDYDGRCYSCWRLETETARYYGDF